MTDTGFKQVEQLADQFGLSAETLANSLKRMKAHGAFSRTASSLTLPEVQFLDAYSGVKPDAGALFDARLSTAIAETQQVESALSTDEVAAILEVSPSRVRQLIKEGRVYALPSSAGRGTTRLFPAWQFMSGAVIPHVGRIAAALPRRFHPLEVEAFFLNATLDELDNSHSMSVVQWLLSGGDVSAVIELASAEAYGI